MVAVVAALAVVVGQTRGAGAAAAALPTGFQQRTVFSGLEAPVNAEFAADGRVFVAEKSGYVKVFDSLSDTSPGVYADLRPQVYNHLDRGLLGMALHPSFPADPRLYVLYSFNGEIGGTYPKWPGDATYDQCPGPPDGPGANSDGCVVGNRLSVLTPRPGGGAPEEQVLVEDWCQQYSSHTTGTLVFGTDGMLYAGGGDGASFTFTDYGQDAYPSADVTPDNPCSDPPQPKGTALTAPSGQGGALRSQDMRTTGDPTTLDGSIIRIDPTTGKAAAGNPTTTGDDNARRIVAYGLRNPFRFTVRPGTNEIWAGDVGWNTYEEINRIPSPTAKVHNFGWPCYEGAGRQSGYDGANLTLCENLYTAGAAAVTAPYFSYRHDTQLGADAACKPGSSSTSGVAFYTGAAYPAAQGFKNALFFSDYARKCVWVMKPGTNGLPDPAKVSTFSAGAGGFVELQAGPGGDIFGVDIMGGRVVRFVYTEGNSPPEAAFKTDVTSGATPLTVHFDGSVSSDSDGDALTYSWDLNGDGTYETTGATPTWTYTEKARVTARLRVSDPGGATDTVATVISAGFSRPTATIQTPTAGTKWQVGQQISFSGSASDAEDGVLPGAALDWKLIMHHCPSNCHEHEITSYNDIAGGQFTAPDHENPSWIELRLTATDSDGLTDTQSLRLDPRTVELTFASNPAGARLTAIDGSAKAPYKRTVIVGSSVSVTAPQPQILNGMLYDFGSWSDGGAASHNLTAPATNTTYTATFNRRTSLSQGRPVKVSSVEKAGLEGPKAVDANPATRWSSKHSSPQYIQVDLGSNKSVGHVLLSWETAYGKSYTVYVSTNGTSWTQVYNTTTGNGGIDDLVFTPRTARYVRVYGRARGTQYGYSLWEFSVYPK